MGREAVAFTTVWMTCQLLPEPIQLAPLPDGLEIRAVSRDQLPAIYVANEDAFAESYDSLESYDTCLGATEENPGKAVHLYERVGYQVVERMPRYRKPMAR